MTAYKKINHYYSRILQESAFHVGGKFGKPTEVILLFTNRCNARCVHCYSWKMPNNDDEMNYDQWRNTLDQLRSWLGPIFLSVTGGETLVKKHATRIAEYACSLGFEVEFLTNGYILDSRTAIDLVQSGVSKVKLSLDGSQAEVHNRIRGRDDFFQRTVQAFQHLVAAKSDWQIEPNIVAKTAIMSYNIHDLPNIVHLAYQLGIQGVEFQAIEPIYYSDQLDNPNWRESNPLWVNDLDALNSSINTLIEMKKAHYPITNSIENLALIKTYFSEPDELAYKIHSHQYKRETRKCRVLSGLQIMPNGDLKMCHWMKPFGNAIHDGIRKSWKERFPCWKYDCKYLK
ncbi:MAG: radical SAM protein [Desulfovermiculus sp.]|nr:radical SAM protein [Desulfovermiculus sp.]